MRLHLILATASLALLGMSCDKSEPTNPSNVDPGKGHPNKSTPNKSAAKQSGDNAKAKTYHLTYFTIPG